MNPKKKILIIYTGGTFGMIPYKNGFKIPRLKATELKKLLIDQVPEIRQIARCDIQVLFNMDSCQMHPHHWFEMADAVMKAQKLYDGVVILHGTDTLSHSAAALSMLLTPSKIPVVFTGAQKPLSMIRSDARQNFISALEVAAHAPSGLQNRVMVCFHDELFLGSRIRKKSAHQYGAFESPRFEKLATIGSDILYHDVVSSLKSNALKKPLLQQFKNHDGPLPKILTTTLSPGFSADLYTSEFIESLDGILLTCYPSGTAPTDQPDFLIFLKRAQELDCPIFTLTERDRSHHSVDLYSAGETLKNEGAIFSPDLTPEAAWIKLWLLTELFHGQGWSREKIYSWHQRHWNQPISDETSVQY
jgi:L-asparaginase